MDEELKNQYPFTTGRCVKALQALCTLWLPRKTRNQWCFTNNDKTQNLPAKDKPDM